MGHWGTLVDIYCDEGKSAKNMKGRPEFLRMLTDLYGQDIDRNGLKAKIERALKNLEALPKEKQRPIFTNLVKFIEIQPMKIKIGMYAPTKEQYKATGTDGTSSPGNENLNFKEKEGKLLPFSPTPCVGSSTVGNGAREAEVEEPLLVAKSILFEVEVDEVGEPKALRGHDLKAQVAKHGSFVKAAIAMGSSEAFVRQNIKNQK